MSQKIKKAKTLQYVRIGVQFLFVILFFYLLLHSGSAHTESFSYSDYFFYFDPLLLLANFIATHKILALFLLSLIPLFLTLIFGRFFCGWVCPFGAINQFFTWMFRKSKKEKKGVNRPLLKLKYIVLVVVVIAALWGTHLSGWLDPFSLLTRSTATAINPAANYALQESLKSGSTETGIVSKTIKPVYEFSREHILTNKQRVFTLPVLIGLLFVLLLVLNLYKRRFYCNYICPLGAIYGLVSRVSFFNLKPDSKCVSCGACAKNCTYNGSPHKDYMKSECVSCFNCVADCPVQSVKVRWALPKKEHRTSIDLGRRRLIGGAILGVTLASLPKAFLHAKTKIVHRFSRPPGSVGEKEFLERCIRCGQCMQVCPTNFIQPAFLEAGVDGMWTPVLNAQAGYCEYECNKCTQVCPTNAIEKLTLEQKKEFKMGTAVIDRNRCYTYADGYNCAVCEEHCPVPTKAIRFREVDTWNFKGKQVKVKQIYVVPNLCVGCGICENVCPRGDSPGIVNTAEEEAREFKY